MKRIEKTLLALAGATLLGLGSAARADIARIEAAVLANPATEITVDLGAHVIRFGSETAKLTMRETARDALVNGRWDSIGELLEGREAVIATASKLPYLAAPQK